MYAIIPFSKGANFKIIDSGDLKTLRHSQDIQTRQNLGTYYRHWI